MLSFDSTFLLCSPIPWKDEFAFFFGRPDYSSGGDCAFYKNNLNSSSEWVEVRGRERHHHCTEAVGCITAKTTKSKLASTVWVSTVLSTRHWDQQKEENTQCFFSSDKQCRNALPVVLASATEDPGSKNDMCCVGEESEDWHSLLSRYPELCLMSKCHVWAPLWTNIINMNTRMISDQGATRIAQLWFVRKIWGSKINLWARAEEINCICCYWLLSVVKTLEEFHYSWYWIFFASLFQWDHQSCILFHQPRNWL